jgi:hypothetical protein
MLSVVRFVSIASVGVALVATGCRDKADRERTSNVDRDRPGPLPEQGAMGEREKGIGTTTVTGANVIGNQAAIDKIVAARCARESTCNNIGPDKKFPSAQTCSQKLKGDMQGDLAAKDCPYGVDQKELDECLDSIRQESCGNPIDSVARLAACRTSDMCLKTEAPNR